MDEDDFHKQPTLPGLPASKESEKKEPIPEKIGQFKVESLLEKGGMSYVYLGTHPETNEPVTIKVLSPKFTSNKEVVERFLKEAKIIGIADHPNIIKLYNQGEWEKGLYIAMEFIQGVSLRQYLQHTPLSLKRALEIILEVAYALCHLHTHGVIHRDLKLENILITDSGQVKVIDFGIAQLLTDRKTPEGDTRPRLIGTPIYMSPEQRNAPESVSFPSDIYSLGIITYELVLGKLSHGKIHLSLMPKGMQKILSRCLQPNPSERYQDVVDLIADLSAYLNSSSLERERSEEDLLSEFTEKLKDAKNSLLPPLPKWEGLQVVHSKFVEGFSSGIFFDFFQLPDLSCGILMATSTAKGAEGMLYNAVVRGMVRVLKKNRIPFHHQVEELNELILNDEMTQVVRLAYLNLDPVNDTLRFTSCGYGGLWHIKAGTSNPQKIASENITLGIDRHAEFHETTHPFESGDELILTNLPKIFSENTSFTKKHFEHWIAESHQLPLQKKGDQLLRKVKKSILSSKEEHSLLVFTIARQD